MAIQTEIHICSRCEVEQGDQKRDFYPLWFTDPQTRTELCPPCAALKAEKEQERGKQGRAGLVIPMQAVWPAQR